MAVIFLISSINSLNAVPLKCVLIKHQECKIREAVVNNEYMTYPYSIKVNRCNGNCNNITIPYSRVCIPDVIKNITVKVCDLISWTNKTRQIKWHDSCKGVCRLDPIICNNKQKWNKNKCRCKCLTNKNCNDSRFDWNTNSCKCEYKKKEALLVEECEETTDNKTVSIKKYNKTVPIKENSSLDSCKPFVVSSILFLLVSVIITGPFIYYYVNSQSKRKLQTFYG